MAIVQAVLFAVLTAQDLPPPPLPRGAEPKALVDIDGRDMRAGELPASTTPAARAAFEKMLNATLSAVEKREPVRAFDLSLDLRYHSSDVQSNDFPDARYRFLAPGFLRAGTGHGREHVRGPNGDWLVDTKQAGDAGKIRLDIGRENAEDRRQLDESASVARLFVALSDPRALRIARLVEAQAAPALPETKRDLAAGLVWLTLESPDVAFARGETATNETLSLGCDRATGIVALARVERGGPAATPLVVALSNYKAVDGFQVPYAILAWTFDPESKAFRARPSIDLVIKRASLRATLQPSDFVP